MRNFIRSISTSDPFRIFYPILTSHPTLLDFPKKDVFKEAKFYAENALEFRNSIEQFKRNHEIGEVLTWGIYDCDGGAKKPFGSFTFQKMMSQSIAISGYKKQLLEEQKRIIQKYTKHPFDASMTFNIDKLTIGHSELDSLALINRDISELDLISEGINNHCNVIERKINSKEPINPDEIREQYRSVVSKIDNFENRTDRFPIANISQIPLKGSRGQYRIGSENLGMEEGRADIKQKLQEIALINEESGAPQFESLIIANCTTPDQVEDLRGLIRESGIPTSKLPVMPLIEEYLSDDQMIALIKKVDEKIMVACSDSVARMLYSGAIFTIARLQSFVIEENEIRSTNNQPPLIIQYGKGSEPNRFGTNNIGFGGMIHVDFKEVPLTVQGQQNIAVVSDPEYFNYFFKSLMQSKGCCTEDIEKAIPILKQIYNESQNTIESCNSKNFTDVFSKGFVTDIVKSLENSGVRAKVIKDGDDVKYHECRAIGKSAIQEECGFFNDIVALAALNESDIDKLVDNIDNPFIQYYVNAMTILYQKSDVRVAEISIKDNNFLNKLKKGMSCFESLVKKLEEAELPPETKDKLFAMKLDDKRESYGLAFLSKEETNELIGEYEEERFKAATARINQEKMPERIYKNRIQKYTGRSFSTMSNYKQESMEDEKRPKTSCLIEEIESLVKKEAEKIFQ